MSEADPSATPPAERQTRGDYCETCRGVRLMVCALVRMADGKVVRRRECPTCQTLSVYAVGDQPGLACPKCEDVRWRTVKTRHRPGVTIRVRLCRHCRHAIRTCERVESFGA